MQVRVPWTQAWLCTKDFRRKCTGAGVAAKVAVPSNAAQRELLVQKGGRLPPEHAPPGNSRESRQDEAIQGCSSRFCYFVAVLRRTDQSAVDPLAEGEEGDAEELW
ncbi:hypothetical protein NDU88_000970 [Pleurodeles waltl]|uniref:Uncharacterized protein n=1 Tax=Pleurodeles waltl TaxID=8319 RepID=A0AAV7RBL1_PLEWA|nr:hypothetical protein NDU88_000970 [Pleurodeles waltl]